MSDLRRYGSSGVHTVEGVVAGKRAASLAKQREQQEQEFVAKKQQIAADNARGSRIDKSFLSHTDASSEAEFKRQTIGLVTAAEYRKRREDCLAPSEPALEATKMGDGSVVKPAPKKKKKKATMSFSLDSDDETDAPAKRKKLKCPFVETAFLPDRDREAALEEEKAALQKEWVETQDRIKKELLSVTFSYWDGAGHRRELSVEKATPIGKFLELVRKELAAEFPDIRTVSIDDLMYIKEDLIIPHQLSFYDLIVTKARGKTGPLFHFDVHDDVRLVNDVRVEKDESHPGKVTHRLWYERNKHIFPASRWEMYDPNVPRHAPYSRKS
ncbi:hypothetical protein SDRG_13681 [Saprolegnia diclina VS20]|uniref:FAM50A/XAP5 C-terminal domain-containing protein n=1 Tax=Saprolegnia diclina (strain VS20) TaxID=1156394 RepID=T0RFZ6_SAPDV|nr:hypothetical protein SDRG_13681 [Saprolegnia diclina VS20]EQC28602.1 hypothetical protein SDRG_13681 [Saprolegnia diclina VS20]|eukprot:XP_008617999.1 hypothetical protein SDRG_13681 [Saprolegnia diclina VS20]